MSKLSKACILFLAAAAIHASASAGSKKPSPIVIDIQPEELEYRVFPKGQPPPGAIHFADETVAGVCVYGFSQSCSLYCTLPRRIAIWDHSATITDVSIRASLSVTIWTEEGSEPGVLEHEETHRAIAKLYYAKTEEIARRLATALLGRKVPISPQDRPPEPLKAMDALHEELLATLRQETSDRCKIAQSKFDGYAYGKPFSAINDAKRQALADEEAEYASARSKGK